VTTSRSTKHDRDTMEKGYAVRRAIHAGSWYESSERELDAVLTRNLQAVVDPPCLGTVRGLVGPHAGYSYSGPTAAYAYHHLTQALRSEGAVVDTILVLHPSHHVHLDGCALSGASNLATPLGNLTVSTDLRDELWKTNEFTMMDQETDENEHSGELHYPYIAKSMRDAGAFDRVRVLPIMIGGINTKKEEHFGSVLKEIIARPNIITIVSTDFCHWGKRFRYQPTPAGDDAKKEQAIFEHISELDHAGMNHVELQQPGAFATYLKTTQNTICGRHPLTVWLYAIAQNKNEGTESLDVKFVRYAQSSQVRSMRDSSVSYASAVATKTAS
jgi:AmmeMemoRadiSam system protein B